VMIEEVCHEKSVKENDVDEADGMKQEVDSKDRSLHSIGSLNLANISLIEISEWAFAYSHDLWLGSWFLDCQC